MTTRAQAGKAHISKDGRTAVVSISVSFRQRGGRKQILSPAGATPTLFPLTLGGSVVKSSNADAS